MIEKLNYISDDELERLINQVEQEELVAAPPDLMESILESAGKTKKKEFTGYCFRVITSVAAAVALVFLLPELTDRMNLNGRPVTEHVEKSDVVGTVPVRTEVVKNVPDKTAVVENKPAPSKEDVLNDTGFIEKIISNTTEWLYKENNDD